VTSRFRLAGAVALSLGLLLSGCTNASRPTDVDSTSTPTPDSKALAIASLQRYLAGEHAAIWAYGRAAWLLPEAEQVLARKVLATHKRERDQLANELRVVGVAPVGALIAYDLGSDLGNAEQARSFLAGVETRLAQLASEVKSIPSQL